MTATDRESSAAELGLSAEESGILRAPKFTREEFNEVVRTRNDIPLFDFAATITLIFVPPLALYFYPSVWTGVLGALVNIHAYNRCAQIAHGSGHNSLFTNKKLDLIAGQIAGWFVGYQRQGHKETHDEHHMYLNSDRDADRVWCEPEARVSSIVRGWIRDLFLVSAIFRFLQYIPNRFTTSVSKADAPPEPNRLFWLWRLAVSFAPIALVQSTILLAYVAAAHFAPVLGFGYYLILYIAPLFILYPMQVRLRSNVEHCFEPGYQCRAPEDRRVVRSIDANWLERMIVAPLNGTYHFEHHLVPTMPYYNSARARAILQRKGFKIPIAKGYVSFIWRRWQTERQMDRQARAR